MNTSSRALKPTVLLSLALLTACGGGGGGGGGSSGADTSLFTYTYDNGLRSKTTVSHALNNEAAITGVTFAMETSSFEYGNSRDLSNYVLDNGNRTFTVSGGLTDINLRTLSANAGNQQVLLGGSQWAYSRYGLYTDKTPNSNLLNTAFEVRNMPYLRYERYFNAVFTNATYNQAGSKAAGALAIETNRQATFTCDISVVASSTGGTASSIDVTLSACDNGLVTTGFLRLPKASVDVGSVSTGSTFSATSNANAFTLTSASAFYNFAGPNSQELIGYFSASGTTLVGGIPRNTRFDVAFGARK